MKKHIRLLFLLVSNYAFTQQDTLLSKKYYYSKVEKYLDKEKSLTPYYTINDTGIFIYSSPTHKPLQPEYTIPWDKKQHDKRLFKCYPDDSLIVWLKNKTIKNNLQACDEVKLIGETDANKKLNGIKIAIDPGHIAGDLKTGMLEKKFLNFKHNNTNIQIAEGILTLQTALILKKMLEAQGAEVMLTRKEPNQTAFGITYKEWLEKYFKASVENSFHKKEISEKEKIFLLTKASEREIFRTYFNNLDMKERVRKINSFSPDLTIVIHYNVDEKNTEWKKATSKNFNMVFIAGSFMRNELENPIDRISFLRMIITDDVEQSEKLASHLIQSFNTKLAVPAADANDADYLKKYCMPTKEKGVYSRNLGLTRLTKGVVAYGETLYQDNSVECLQLIKQDTEVFGVKTSKRIVQVAEAYFEGIINYIDSL